MREEEDISPEEDEGLESDPVVDDLVAHLIPIAISTLRPLSELGFDLYVQGEEGDTPTLYRQRNYPLVQEDIDRLIEADVANLYITELGRLRYQQYLEEHLDEFLADEHTPIQVRFGFLHDAAQSMLENAFRIINVSRIVDQANRVGHQVIDLISGRQLLPIELFRMMRHDYQLFTHMINVSGYCVLLAERLGISEREELEQIAVGALLHDIGMRAVPDAVMNKAGKLTQREQDLFERHPLTGYEELHERDELTWGQLMMVYQHHERCDGSGYPVRVTGEEIHWMARLCAVVDSFDTLTCPRRASRALHLSDAVAYLEAGSGSLFDKEFVQCWTSEMLAPA